MAYCASKAKRSQVLVLMRRAAEKLLGEDAGGASASVRVGTDASAGVSVRRAEIRSSAGALRQKQEVREEKRDFHVSLIFFFFCLCCLILLK